MAQSAASLSEIKTRAAAYIKANKQAAAWDDGSVESITKLLTKICRVFTIDGIVEDKLPELEGDYVISGQTLEEYYCNFYLPSDFDESGTNTLKPKEPNFENATYHYALSKKTFGVTVRDDEYEAAVIGGDVTGIVGKILQRLQQSADLWRFACKKQLLGNLAARAIKVDGTDGNLVKVLAKPGAGTTDNETRAEAFIKAVKNCVEEAQFPTENTSLSKVLIGSAPSLTLFLNKAILSSIEVDCISGAFQRESLSIPASIKVLDSFGASTVNLNPDGTADNVDVSKVYGILVDTRGVKLHNTYRNIKSQQNAEGNFTNYFEHLHETAVISKYVYVKVFKDVTE